MTPVIPATLSAGTPPRQLSVPLRPASGKTVFVTYAFGRSQPRDHWNFGRSIGGSSDPVPEHPRAHLGLIGLIAGPTRINTHDFSESLHATNLALIVIGQLPRGLLASPQRDFDPVHTFDYRAGSQLSFRPDTADPLPVTASETDEGQTLFATSSEASPQDRRRAELLDELAELSVRPDFLDRDILRRIDQEAWGYDEDE